MATDRKLFYFILCFVFICNNLITMASNNNQIVQTIVQAAIDAARSEEQRNNLLQQTRETFRPNRNSKPRGRKPLSIWKRSVFLVRRSNVDYLPCASEAAHLTAYGMGKSENPAVIQRNWTMDILEDYLCSLYPRIPLKLVGFRYAKCNKQKKITLVHVININELESEINKGFIILVPIRDLPLSAQYTANTNLREPIDSDFIQAQNSNLSGHMDDQANENIELGENDIMNNTEIRTLAEDYISDSESDFNPNSNLDYNLQLEYPSVGEDIKEISLNRCNLTEELFDIYEKDDLILEKKLHVQFLNESGADFGGITKEMFTNFWLNIEPLFFYGEHSVVPYIPLHRIIEDLQKFHIIGKILTHMASLLKVFPVKLSVSTLALIGNIDQEFENEFLVKEFMLFVTCKEMKLLKKSINNFSHLSKIEKESLQGLFSTYGMYALPKEDVILLQIATIAKKVLVSQTIDFIKSIRDGIPLQHLEMFWSKLTVQEIIHIKDKENPTVEKLIRCLVVEENLTNDQNRILYYFQQYIISMKNNYEMLEKFLLFITGSITMPLSIIVSFTNLIGLNRRPIVHTCSCTIELSVSYNNFQEFRREFNQYLLAESSYEYSQL